MSFADSFRIARWIRLLNLLLQAAMFLTLFGGLNYLALHYAWRYDLTRHRTHSLSPETLSYLRELRHPVRIVVTLTADSDNPELAQAYHDVRGLLREYEFATQASPEGRITVEYLDVFQRRRDAEALGFERPNTILLLCGDRRSVVGLDQLYRVEQRRKQAFQGECAFTSAILDISNPQKKKICFLAGHGEMRPDDVDGARGLSQLGDELRQRNFQVETLDLSLTKGVPDDASLLIAASPQGRFQPFEQELLRQYLTTRAGRLILLLDPGRPHGLDGLLYDWGILADDDVICDTNPEGVTDNGDLVLRSFNRHPITQALIDYMIPWQVGPARSVRPDPGRPDDASLTITPLVATAKTAWGELNYRERTSPQFLPGVDLPGPLPVVTLSERIRPPSLSFSVSGGRLVVFGTADVVTNNRIINPGNLTLFLGAVNWTVDRDMQLNIPARPIERFQLSLNQTESARLRLSLLLIIPGGTALLGLAVYWTRRR